MTIYTEKGFESRDDYLDCLADDYDLSTETVYQLAEFFGPLEDFDGLIIALEDQAEYEWNR